jgi:mono/diheme cytochrome c family protein
VRLTSSMVASALAGLMLSACGGSQESNAAESSTGSELAQYEGPIASTDVERGQELFSAHCDDCHPGGEEDVGPSLIADPHNPAQLRKQVREGSGKMKAIPEKRLDDDGLEAVLAYLASINAVK